MTDAELQAVEDIYHKLVKGLGHEHVNDGNVAALIRRAELDGRTLLATELREWQAPCGTRAKEPGTLAPTKGFNRDHVKH